jgi:hypothetical protein
MDYCGDAFEMIPACWEVTGTASPEAKDLLKYSPRVIVYIIDL